MKEYGTLYKNWIKFLIKKKLYGIWMKDVAMMSNYMLRKNIFERTCSNIWYLDDYKVELTLNTNNQCCFMLDIIKCDNTNNFINYIGTLSTFKLIHPFYGDKMSKTSWRNIYNEFEKLNTSSALSKKLSRKIYRANNKVLSNKWHYREKEIQPWYNKSYEKYNKNLWRK